MCEYSKENVSVILSTTCLYILAQLASQTNKIQITQNKDHSHNKITPHITDTQANTPSTATQQHSHLHITTHYTNSQNTQLTTTKKSHA